MNNGYYSSKINYKNKYKNSNFDIIKYNFNDEVNNLMLLLIAINITIMTTNITIIIIIIIIIAISKHQIGKLLLFFVRF